MSKVRLMLLSALSLFVLLCASLPLTAAPEPQQATPTPAPGLDISGLPELGQAGRVLFEDDFSDNSARWPTRNEGINYTLRNGTYTVEILPAFRSAGIMLIPAAQEAYITNDFEVSVQVANVTTSNSIYCMMLVFNAQEDFSGVYRYFICTNESWYLWDTQGKIGEGTVDRLVNFGGQEAHTIGLRYQSGLFTALLDGEKIGELEHEATIDGFVGFGLSHEKDGGGATITGTFDNFKVLSLVPPIQPVGTPIVGNPTPVPSGVLFSDDFSTNAADWETGTGDGYESQVVNGTYLIRLDNNFASAGWHVAPGFTDWSKAPIMTQPFIMQFEISKAKCKGTECYVTIIFNVQQNYEDYVILYYHSNEGRWTLRQQSVDSVLGAGNVDKRVGNLFNGSTHTVALQVERIGLTLFQDGEEVVRISQPIEIDGSVGFGLSRDTNDSTSTLIATFDNFVVQTRDS